MNATRPNILVIGFGNPGRGDDGLGPALAEAIERMHLPQVAVDADYQLTVEDAAEAAQHDLVVFADAAVSGPAPFWIKKIAPSPDRLGFTTHGVEPEGVLALCRDLFGAEPEAILMGIRGYEFDQFRTDLSPAAQANLEAAVAHLRAAFTEHPVQEFNIQPPDNILVWSSDYAR